MQQAKLDEFVFLNGQFLKPPEAKASVLGPGFLYGWGLFETMRFYNNNIICLDGHLGRLKKSGQLTNLRMPYPCAKLKALIKQTVRQNRLSDAYVRLTICKSDLAPQILITARQYHPYPASKYMRGFSLCISAYRQNENSLFSRIKSTSRLLYELAYAKARERKCDDALILNNRGYVCEASRSNIFVVKDNTLFTPGLDCGCLEGITRRIIFALAKGCGIKPYECNLTVQHLLDADSAFLTNSLMGVMPLAYLEGHKITGSAADKTVKLLMQKYNLLLKYGSKKNKIAF
jgi:branched-chain amino acid aminotransferase